MKAYITCIKGLEEISLLELKELLGVEGKVEGPGRITFESEQEKIAKFCYYTRSCFGVYQLFAQFTFRDLNDLEKQLEELEVPSLVEPFKVSCNREGKHPFKSQDIEKLLGGKIYKTGLQVNLEQAKSIVHVDIQEQQCLIGIDYAGFKLNKRDYRIKVHQESVNPLLSYALVRLSGWKEEETLLDPLAKTGDICIEAALHALKIPNGYHQRETFLFNNILEYDEEEKIDKKKLQIHCIDALHSNVRNAEVNAKLADVVKSIQFSRKEAEWLETKFKEGEIDRIVTVLPSINRGLSEEEALELYKEFFYQAEYLLDKGTITLLSTNTRILDQATDKFEVLRELQPQHGKEGYSIRIYKKSI